MSIVQPKVHPFLKWAGGKSKLLKNFREYYPSSYKIYYNRYIEPFLGSGSVFFDLYNRGELRGKEVILSDSNEALILCYQQLKEDSTIVLKELQKLLDQYWGHSKGYTMARNEYNELVLLSIQMKTFNDLVRQVALFIYLNKTCFNGLYRVNSKGLFNVPEGRYHRPPTFDFAQFESVSESLKDVTILNMDYQTLLDKSYPNKDDFIYIDPPYLGLSNTAYFSRYSQSIFGINEQKRLASYCNKLVKKGCYILISNHWHDDLVCWYDDDLFKKVRLQIGRPINSKIDLRKNQIDEVLFVTKYM